MASGGARARSGPAPDPAALRRDRRSDPEWLRLPVIGRKGPTPTWPLSTASPRELELWADEWRRPQAVIWEMARQHRQVALYIRCLAEAETPHAAVDRRTIVRQLEETLGISLTGLARHHWLIVDDRPVRTPSAAKARARDRLEVIRGGA